MTFSPDYRSTRERTKSIRSDASFSSFSSSTHSFSKSGSWAQLNNFDALQRQKSMQSSASSKAVALEDQFCGWLWMRSSKFGRWRHRYFCLNGTMLSYFVTFPSEEFLKQASQNAYYFMDGTQPRGVVRIAHVDDTDSRLGFKVYGTCGKIIDIRAPRVDVRNEWLRALKTPARRKSRSWSAGSADELTMRTSAFDSESTRTLPERQSIPVLKSGWMLKQSDVLKRWNRYFFVIQGKMVSYYASDKPYEVPRRRGYVTGVSVVRAATGIYELQIRLHNQPAIYVRAPSEEDLDEWRSCLLACVDQSKDSIALSF